MTLYRYKAKKSPAEYQNGEIEADSVGAARVRLRAEGVFPFSIAEDAEDGAAFRGFGRKVKSDDLAAFARQLGNLIGAGVPALRSIEILSGQIEKPRLRRATVAVGEDLQRGTSLAEALRRRRDVFPPAFAASIHAGETGGTLDVVLGTLADHYETEGELWSSVKAALIYPCFLAIAGAATIFVLMTFVIPHFTVLFEEFGSELPAPTKVLLGMSEFMTRFWWAFPAAGLGAFVLFNRFRKKPEGRLLLDRARLVMPLVGKLVHKSEMARLARTLGMLLRSGVGVVDAMAISGSTLRNQALAAEVEGARSAVHQGEKVADALAGVKYFPAMLTCLVAVGEQTGELAGAFAKAADIYEREVQRYSRVLSRMLEPMMIVLVGGAVGFIVMATLLPVFRLSTMVK
jgi:type II secretory pathway component PulF